MTTRTPAALARVRQTETDDPNVAADITIDYTGGGDYADLTLNPSVGLEATHGYRIRAGVMAALEPLRRYNRAMTRRYGTYKGEQQQFQDAYAKALAELEELVHLAPAAPGPADLPAPSAPTQAGQTPLPDDYPEVEALREAGYRTVEAVRDAPDADLRAVPGIGPKRLDAIRQAGQPAPATPAE